MRIKKAICHQSLTDSPRTADKQKPITPASNQDITTPDKKFRELNKLFYRNYGTHPPILNIEPQRASPAHGLSRILRRSNHMSVQKEHQSKEHFKSSPLSPQKLSPQQNQSRFQKHRSQVLQTQQATRKLIVEKMRSNETPISRIRYKKSSRMEDRQQSNTKDNDQSPLDHQVNQIVRNSLGKSKEISFNYPNNSNTKHQYKDFVTLSTIKQRIQKYLSEEESKLKQFKSANIYSPNHKLHNKQKGSKLQIEKDDQGIEKQTKHQGGIFTSLASLARKRQTKFAHDMMKRRLNFSMINKSMKDRQSLIKNRNGSTDTRRRRSLNEEQMKNVVMNNGLTEEDVSYEKKILYALENQPKLLSKAEKDILLNMGFKIKRNAQQESNINKTRMNTETHIELQSEKPEQLQNNENSSSKKTLLSPKEKSHLYNLYYPSEYITEQVTPNESYKASIQHGQETDGQNDKYKSWKKQTPAQQRLKQLLRNQSHLVDPIQCYYDSFLNKKYSIDAISSLISMKKDPSSQILFSSNSSSLSPLHKRTKLKFMENQNKCNPEVDKLDQRIIFVSKKQKQNLQQKKLSNLLNKIEKRNSQIQKLAQVQAIKIFNLSKQSYKQRKINGLNMADYVEEQDLLQVSREQILSSNNFLVQWPKKEVKETKLAHAKSVDLAQVKSIDLKKKNNNDWTEFQPWKDPTQNQPQYGPDYGDITEKK